MSIEQLLLTVVKPGREGVSVWKVRGLGGRWDYDTVKPCLTVPDLNDPDCTGSTYEKALAVWLHEAGHSHQHWSSLERDIYSRNPVPRECDAWRKAIGFAKQLGLGWTADMHLKMTEGLESYLDVQPTASNHELVQNIVRLSLGALPS